MIIASAYFADGREMPSKKVRKVVNYFRSNRLIWSLSIIIQRGEKLLGYLLGTDLELLNESTEPTFVSDNRPP